MAQQLTIDHLGAKGDGVARTPDGPVFIDRALPGETVLAEVADGRGRLIEVLRPSPMRVAQDCAWFGRCGGCVSRHMAPQLYAEWKTGAARAALQRAGVAVELRPLVHAGGSGRRRVTLHGRSGPGGPAVGFMAPRSHELAAIDRCPELDPGLARAPQVALAFTRLLAAFGKPLDIQLTATLGGLDVDIRGLGERNLGRQAAATRLRLVALAEQLDLARLSLHGDVLVERRPPFVPMGRALVRPAPGGFLQATAAGEQALADIMLAAAGKAKRVADCFSGCGPFALRLAERAETHAIELDEAALAALDRGFRDTPGLKRVTTERRDLFRRPLLPPEIDRFDALVLDPPRAGAEALVRQIAAARIGKVVYVSCDAATFARDAAILLAGGFAAASVTPVDQFRHSAHTEIIGVFERAARARR
ncbi:class I SAM-dependent RNA methyltransferase [Camelimonas abortus]|uniref:Class I SAM-dependent RNA methyltransferase n=1 Tax=Camelimonas abortus TaxID=1017184 RepID=A0ABV7LDP3_9HYPH